MSPITTNQSVLYISLWGDIPATVLEVNSSGRGKDGEVTIRFEESRHCYMKGEVIRTSGVSVWNPANGPTPSWSEARRNTVHR